MNNQAKYLFSSNFDAVADAGAAGSLLAIAHHLEQQGHVVDCLWRPEGCYRLPHARLREAFELPEMLRVQLSAQMARGRYDYVIASQPYAHRAFSSLRGRYPETVFLNRTHGWEQRLNQANRLLGWRKEPPLKEALSRVSQAITSQVCRMAVRSADGVIASSTLCGDYIRKRYRLPENRVAVIPHGFSTESQARRLDCGSGMRMLFVGQYLPRKGSGVLERELPKVLHDSPDSTVTFVVPPESVAMVKHHFQAAGSRLTVHAWMPQDRLAEIYREHDILLYPSLFEGFGKVFLEGMAAGMCVVGFAEGGIADIATCGRDALIAEPGNALAFRNLLCWALRHPARARLMGRVAAETASQWTWNRTAQATHTFCQMRRAERFAVRELVTHAEPFTVEARSNRMI